MAALGVMADMADMAHIADIADIADISDIADMAEAPGLVALPGRRLGMACGMGCCGRTRWQWRRVGCRLPAARVGRFRRASARARPRFFVETAT